MPNRTPSTDRVSLGRHKASVERAIELKAQIAALSDELSAEMTKIKAAMGDATIGTIGRKTVARWSISTRQQVSTKALKDEMPEIARKFTRTVEVRSFQLVTDDE